MKLKDLFNVLLGAQDVRIFSAGAISMWGEVRKNNVRTIFRNG